MSLFVLYQKQDHINSFQVDLPPLYHLKTSGFLYLSRCLEREYWPEMGKP